MSPAIASGHDEPPPVLPLGELTVLGVDPSLTATCTCLIRPSGSPLVEVHKTSPKSGSDREKLDRMRRQADSVRVRAERADLIVMEGAYTAVSRGRTAGDIAGLWWLVYDRLMGLNVPVAIAAPSVRAKWATGKGNAGKFEVGQHIGKRWPDTELRSDDEADALVLASMALHRVGALPWAATKPQDEALAKVAWPDLPDPTAKGAA